MTKFFALLLLVAPFFAQAAQQPTPEALTIGRLNQVESTEFSTGLKPFFGLGTGYLPYDSQAPVEGVASNFKLISSYIVKNGKTVFDLGAGLNQQQFAQSSPYERIGMGAMLEAAARYQWPSRWQAGVVLNNFLNQGKNYHASQGDAHFAGLQVLREMTVASNWLARVGGRAMMETNHTGNQVSMFMIELQLGWNPRSRAAVGQQPETSSLHYARKDPGQERLTSFELSRRELSADDRGYLKKLAKVLKEKSALYGKIVVHGYADGSGPVTLNQRLSLDRAETVRLELQKESGLGDARFISVGNGSLGSYGAEQSDRRIELKFEDVRDQVALLSALSSVD